MSENTTDNSTRLQKFSIDFIDAAGENKKFMIESLDGEGLRNIELPFHFNVWKAEEITAQFYTKLESFEKIDDLDFFQYLLLDSTGNDEFDEKRKESMLFRNLPKEYFQLPKSSEVNFPDMTYCDITEKDMFGYPAISSANLCAESGGIWTMHGFRKFELTVKDMSVDNSSDYEQKVNLYWYRIDATPIKRIFETEIRCIKSTMYTKERKYIAYINTNELGKAINTEIESKHPIFAGRFEIHNIYKNVKSVYSFPISICVRDTTVINGKNELMNSNMVSIDFGTSSTCAAVRARGKNQLLRLSGPDKRISDSDNAYENPTNLMIYRWDEIYNQWQADNLNCPFFLTKSDKYGDKEADYDSGYTVEDEFADMADVNAQSKMRSIITQIKIIPQLLSEGKEIKFTSFKGQNRVPVMITDSIENNTKEKFNPIAFYGYLLGRAINDPAKGAFYKNYQITYPVKFNEKIREKIRISLEYGIKRSLPISVRDAVDKTRKPIISIKMNYPEPIACIGSIVGKQLQISDSDNAAKLFAIYDLGGGTVDFAFGMFRPALTEDEADEFDQYIEIFGVEGENDAGGEFLIHELAYKIYLDNREFMEKNRIKFVKPEKLLDPKGFENLLSVRGDYVADANVNIIKENLARPMFIYGSNVEDHLSDMFANATGTKVKLERLINENAKDITDIELVVNGIDDFIRDKIRKTIDSFKQQMERLFKKNIAYIKAAGINEFNIDDVYIFLSGNASKQRYVHEIMNEKFSANNERNHIQRIGEGQNDDEFADSFRVNEKTAVAFGQLKIGAYGYEDRMSIAEDETDLERKSKTPPFLYNVGYINPGNDEFVLVIAKMDKRTWKKAGKIDAVGMTTNLYYTTSMNCDPNSLIPVTDDISDFIPDERKKRTLYIRINDEKSIEYRIGGVNEIPSEDEDIDWDMIINFR